MAKGEIVEALPATGVAVLNADDELTAALGARTNASALTFGRAGDVSWRAVELDDLGRPSFDLGYSGGWERVRLRLSGAHQVANAAAAAAIAVAAGMELGPIVTALSTAEPASRWRMELHERADGLLLINDAYNANPASMAAAIDTLAEIGRRRGRRTVAVLGEMKELGDDHVAAHRSVGLAAAAAAIDVVVVVGEAAEGIAAGAAEHEEWAGEVILTASRSEAVTWMGENALSSDVVLVKASRGAALEEIAEALLVDGPDHGATEGDAVTR